MGAGNTLVRIFDFESFYDANEFVRFDTIAVCPDVEPERSATDRTVKYGGGE